MSTHRIRVTSLSPRTARIEFSPTGEFIDEPSFLFCQRGEPTDWPSIERRGKVSVHTSENLEIHVAENGADLRGETLEVRWTVGNRSGTWRPGDIDDQNLGGPFSALDDCSRWIAASDVRPFDPMVGQDACRTSTHDLAIAVEKVLAAHLDRYPEIPERNEEIRRMAEGEAPLLIDAWPEEVWSEFKRVRTFPPGFLSRGGLTIIRDTGPLWDSQSPWTKPRPEGHIDLTVIACGNDFKGTLGEIARLAGPIPRLPLFALGIWFSCFREMGTREFQQLSRDFEKHDLPLDMIVVDNDWHTHWWHGFDWNRKLFPDPEAFFEWAKREGLHSTFNVHPRYLPADDSRARQFIERSGHSGEALTKDNAPHPLHVDCLEVDFHDPAQVREWFELHRSISEAGCEFWWIDGAERHPDGREATVWMNHLYHQHMADMGRPEPLAFSRASGLGCHRTTLPFSGDTLSQWESLAQTVEVTIRGACALLGHWSHDIGGFFNGELDWEENKPPLDLFVRWVQVGCLSPIMRLHSEHGVREPWEFGDEGLRLSREAMNLRMRLVPHLHSLTEEAHRTGVSMWRPMCFEFPEEEESFRRWHQTMIGESLLFAPVLNPSGEVEVWFPEGRWMHLQSRRVVEGPTVERWVAPLEEIPLFLRSGHTLRLADPVKRTRDLNGAKLTELSLEM